MARPGARAPSGAHLEVAAAAGPHERREAVRPGQLRARPVLEQRGHDVHVAALAREVERAPPLVRDRPVEQSLGLGAHGGEDGAHGGEVALLRREHQRVGTAAVVRVRLVHLVALGRPGGSRFTMEV